MVEREGGQLREEENILASSLSPFRSNLYSTLWSAALFLFIGASMYDVGASWLMTSLVQILYSFLLSQQQLLYQFFSLQYPLGHYLIFLTGVIYSLLLVHTC